jgi:cellulose synthase/poly-beta-1,6-N-acetylglucosamine synthase-like glycosyltransferase
LATPLEYVVMGLGALFAVYSIYLGTLFVVGGYSIFRRGIREEAAAVSSDLPLVSVLVAVKDEASVASRLISSLKTIAYDLSKIEFVIVEDGSSDGTLESIRRMVRGDTRFRLFHVENTLGKAGALNHGLLVARGELIFLMDADCVPQSDLLLKAVAQYRRGRHVLVGYFKVINAGQNVLTRLSVFEELLWHVMNVGRNRLGLSVPVSGCCTVISRQAFLKAGFNFNPHLAEDAELGLRLLKAGYPGYHFGSYVWQEAPSRISSLVSQRLRWYRGYLDAMLRNTDIFRRTDLKKAVDSILNFSTPFFALFTTVSWVLSVASIPQAASSFTLLLFVAGFLGANLASFILMGVGLAIISGQDAAEMVKLSPLLYVYTTLLSLASMLAIVQFMFHRRGVWTKTPRTGYVDVPVHLVRAP